MAESGLIIGVRWEWDGTEIADETVAAGATSFNVVDPSSLTEGEPVWFGDTGPHILVTMDEDTGAVTVSPGLPVAMEEGDPLVPDAGGQPARMWIAEVVLTDADGTVEVVLNSSELLYLPEGIYSTPSPVVLSDDLLRIIDLPGQLPTLDPEILDPETIPYEAWGVTPRDEFDAAVGAIEGDFTDVYDSIASGDSANAQAIDAAVADYLQRFTTVVDDSVEAVQTLWGMPGNTTVINGGMIGTNTILAQSLVLADWSNYIHNPGAETGSLSPHVGTPGISTATVTQNALGVRSGAYGFWVRHDSALPDYVLSFNGPRDNPAQKMPVKVGDHIRGEAWVRRGSALNTGIVAMTLIQIDGSGATVSLDSVSPVGESLLADMTVTGWQKIAAETEITDPSVTHVVQALGAADATVNSFFYADDVALRRMAGGELIVDGAVQAHHLTADSITGLLVTGATIQTHDDGPPPWASGRGVKISNSGLLGFPAAGAASPTFAFNSSTGRAHLTGGMSTGTGYDDVSITPGTASTPSEISFWSNHSLYDNAGEERSGLYCTGDSGIPDAVTTTFRGPKITSFGVRPRIELRTWQNAPTSATADALYHAGESPGATLGNHVFILNGTTVAAFNRYGLTLNQGNNTTAGRIGIGVNIVDIPQNTIHTIGAVRAGIGFFDLSVASGANTGWQGTDARWNNNGRLVGTGSTRRIKEDIEPLPLDVALRALDLEPVTFRYRAEQDMGDTIFPGVIAEQAEEVGLDLWVTRDAEGDPAGFRYPELTAAHNLLIQDLYRRIEALEARDD